MIRQATQLDSSALAALAVQLWPGHTETELETELRQLIASNKACFFLKFNGQVPIGFAQCQLRHDYVEGTHSCPVGYLEGIYICEAHRRQGFARELLSVCEAWAKEHGCTEFASDCELTNEKSFQFHRSMGFSEANRIICFTKKI